MSEKKQPIEESLSDFVSTLGTPTDHRDMSVSYLIAEVLNVEEHERKDVILPAFMHGMLAGLKIAGK